MSSLFQLVEESLSAFTNFSLDIILSVLEVMCDL